MPSRGFIVTVKNTFIHVQGVDADVDVDVESPRAHRLLELPSSLCRPYSARPSRAADAVEEPQRIKPAADVVRGGTEATRSELGVRLKKSTHDCFLVVSPPTEASASYLDASSEVSSSSGMARDGSGATSAEGQVRAPRRLSLDDDALDSGYSPPSVGSLGHPFTCERACKFHRRTRGCKGGSACQRCHRCFWSRAAERAAPG